MDFNIGGFRPDPNLDDHEAFDSSIHIKSGFLLQGESDWRSMSVKRHNQDTTSTCVANAMTKVYEIKHAIKYGVDKHVDLSRLSVYYSARSLMNPPEVNKDEGTHIYLAAEGLKQYGICRESMHPFIHENLFVAPSIMADREEFMNKIDSHFAIKSKGEDRINDICANLSVGNPVTAAFLVGDNWFNYGVNSEPLGKTTVSKGWHALAIIGFINGTFIIENSWGISWGSSGFCFVKPEVIADPTQMVEPHVIFDAKDIYFEKR